MAWFFGSGSSKGKGKAKEPNPIGFTTPPKKQTLCSVGFATKQSLLATPKQSRPATRTPEQEQVFTESVRVRDSEIEAALYDTTTGEFFQRRQNPSQGQKQIAEKWVKAALNNRQLA